MKTTKLLMTVGIIAAIFSGCSKGDTGAAGPAGANGANGSSNVTVSPFNVASGSWIANGADNWYYNTSIVIPNTDVCIVYVELNNGSFAPLSHSDMFYANDNLSFNYQTGYYIQLDYYNPSNVAISSVLNFNIADIPPAMQVKYPNTNWNDYSQVNTIMQTEAAKKN